MTKILKVPLFGQETDWWCWAASAQMIMDYAGHAVPQCIQANHRFNRKDCCKSPRPGPCVNGGWPNFPYWKFACQITPWGTALTFDQLRAQIDHNQPLEFAWGWLGGDAGNGHALVATGYDDATQFVYINDPWPPRSPIAPGGDQYALPYQDWVAVPNKHEHWRDYYDIKYIGGVGGVAAALPERESVNPEANAPKSFPSALGAARNALQLFPALARPDSNPSLGFEVRPHDAGELRLDPPLSVFYIHRAALVTYQDGSDVHRLLSDGEETIYPVRHGESTILSSVAVAQRGPGWTLKSLGGSNLARELTDARDSLARTPGGASSASFVVHIQSLYLIFIGHNGVDGKLLLTPVFDNPGYGLTRHETRAAEEVIQAILPTARSLRTSLPPQGE